jgi:uncharacterized RDD family membrane protein YckC
VNRIGATAAAALVATLAAAAFAEASAPKAFAEASAPRALSTPQAASAEASAPRAAAQTSTRRAQASTPKQAEEVPAPQVERIEPVERPWGYPVLRIGQSYTLKNGETARHVTVIFGDANIDGRVDRDVVVVLGSANLSSTAVIDGSLVVVGGSIKAVDGAKVNEDLFVGGGGLEAPVGFAPGGHYVAIGSTALGGYFQDFVPWLTRGLLWGRPIVPGLSWVWAVAGLFFLLNLLLNVVFDAPVKASAATMRATPMSAFMTGLLVMLLAGPVCLLLAVSVIGIAVVPFVACALLIAAVFGKIAFARWIGMSVVHQDEPDNRSQSMRSFLIGSAVMCVAYMIPIVGFVTWALAGVFGLGASTMAFFSAYRRENPKPPRKIKTPAPESTPPSASAPPPSIPATEGPSPSVAFATAMPAAEEPLYAAVATGAADAGTGAAATELVMLPRAAFVERLAAFVLDAILVIIIVQVLDIHHEEARVGFLVALAYHISFWTLKSTTLGGIICQLRLVRVDGERVTFPDALVRGLTGIFSLAVFGIGFLWILKDPDKQAWHDRVAGTYVVKVPRNFPI